MSTLATPKSSLQKLSRALLVFSLLFATGSGSWTCIWVSGDVDDLCLRIEQPSTTGYATTAATTVVISGCVGGWDDWNDAPDVTWANDTAATQGGAYRDDNYFQTPAIGLFVGSNTIRVRAANGWDHSAQRTIVVTRTP
jgi:hypothetical protein